MAECRYKFGAQLSVATTVTAPNFDNKYAVLALDDGQTRSVKRVATAVGEGAMAVKFVHEYLKEM